ncbi:hypothetical protein GW17_00055492, partial [Ensete ventricosum]
YNPYWLLNIANAAIVVHLVGAYQVFCQPLFAFIEKWAVKTWPESTFIAKEIAVPLTPTRRYNLSLFRLVWRSAFVVLTTVISMLLPFFNDVVGLLGALGFWPLTVYFPVEMYIVRQRIPRWSTRWVCLQMLSLTCLAVTIAAAIGSVAGVVTDLNLYRPFKTRDLMDGGRRKIWVAKLLSAAAVAVDGLVAFAKGRRVDKKRGGGEGFGAVNLGGGGSGRSNAL